MDLTSVVRRIRFGHCTLDEARGVLVAPDGGETVLRPKTLDLLRFLLRNPGRVVARGEILDAVWPGIFVTDDSITQCVVELRKAMGDAGASLLRTMPRRGYLLQAEVAADAPPAAFAPPLLSPRADDRPSIAVLPFRRDNPDPEDAYFADGIIEGIVHVLAGLDGIFVIGRSSALAFAQVTTDARAAGRELGVRYVLYGGVRRAGGRLRITTELTDAVRGTILRTDRYDGDAADLFALQDRISEAVVTTIAPELRGQEMARALRKPPASLSAYDLVLRALNEIRRLDRAAMDRARALLAQAMAADPDSALPHSYTAWWHSLRIAQGWAGAEEEAAAGRHAAAALERDPHDAFSLALGGFLRGYAERDFAPARRMLDQAVATSPSCAMAWSWGGALRCWLDEGPEALRWAERGLRLAPFDPFTFLHEHILAQAHYTAGDFDRAAAFARDSMASNPQHLPNWRTLAAALVALGREEEARRAAAAMLARDPGFSLRAFAARTPLQGAMRDLFVERLRRSGLPE
ncbi:winged helix-turn-helix domain-containing protein [Falsiroseomonas sp. CW058]|uniref:winged helix-turn-helix domain-containing protein n=1 Tax=Falsiroseomonas sp. CW058 TaxID=3388664 RepID=UPI003D310234